MTDISATALPKTVKNRHSLKKGKDGGRPRVLWVVEYDYDLQPASVFTVAGPPWSMVARSVHLTAESGLSNHLLPLFVHVMR